MKAKICGFLGLEEAFRCWREVVWFAHVFLHCLKLCWFNIDVLMGILPWFGMQSLLLQLLLSSFLSPRISVYLIVVSYFWDFFYCRCTFFFFFKQLFCRFCISYHPNSNSRFIGFPLCMSIPVYSPTCPR